MKLVSSCAGETERISLVCLLIGNMPGAIMHSRQSALQEQTISRSAAHDVRHSVRRSALPVPPSDTHFPSQKKPIKRANVVRLRERRDKMHVSGKYDFNVAFVMVKLRCIVAVMLVRRVDLAELAKLHVKCCRLLCLLCRNQ